MDMKIMFVCQGRASQKVPQKPDIPMVLRLEKVLTTPRLHYFERALLW